MTLTNKVGFTSELTGSVLTHDFTEEFSDTGEMYSTDEFSITSMIYETGDFSETFWMQSTSEFEGTSIYSLTGCLLSTNDYFSNTMSFSLSLCFERTLTVSDSEVMTLRTVSGDGRQLFETPKEAITGQSDTLLYSRSNGSHWSVIDERTEISSRSGERDLAIDAQADSGFDLLILGVVISLVIMVALFALLIYKENRYFAARGLYMGDSIYGQGDGSE
jgi:hypothetical protein